VAMHLRNNFADSISKASGRSCRRRINDRPIQQELYTAFTSNKITEYNGCIQISRRTTSNGISKLF
jgi:hypothetical protein